MLLLFPVFFSLKGNLVRPRVAIKLCAHVSEAFDLAIFCCAVRLSSAALQCFASLCISVKRQDFLE